MSSDYVETGLTFSEEGSPYCPIERKRRGAGAVMAAMAVFALGAGFLGFSIINTPETQAPHAALDAPEPAGETVGPAAQATETLVETQAPIAASGDPIASARDAIAQSRAARAGVAAETTRQAKEPSGGLNPRLKPASAPLMPAAAAPKESDAANQRPVRLGSARLAAVGDRTPPFFFESDLKRRESARNPAALAFASDLERQPGETRVRIARGETFVDALKRAGVSAADRNEAAYAFGKHHNLRRLLPGQEFALTLGWPNQTLFQLAADGAEPQARLMALEFRPDPENKILMRRSADGALAATKAEVPLTTRKVAVAGRINGSLYQSAKAVGAPDEIIAELAEAFAYDVDFQREIFGGDEFEAIFEVKYDDRGARVAAGDIVYARLNWRGRREEKGYYRFESEDDGGRADFYDAAGQSARRLLMKTPIDGARLSSGFGMRRHPILGYRRAHRGVDFAAPSGTPIKAAGDGVIERADWYGSFGNYIRIRHANGYKTAYAHLKGFRRGIKKGKRVRQGDIIGYVGTTGRSTGPHLHYEVHLNGKAVNPQRLRIATGKQLKGAELERFKQVRDRIDAMRLPEANAPHLLAKDDESGAESAL